MVLPTALLVSGIPREQFSEDLQFIFDTTSSLLKSPSLSSLASSTTSSGQSSESGVSSMTTLSSSESTVSITQSLEYYLELIDKLEENFFDLFNTSSVDVTITPVSFDIDVEVIYENRDILDLAGNIDPQVTLMQYASFQDGVANFFQNRSQYSRVNGAELPPHVMVTCSHVDCDFNEPKYY